MKTVFLAIVILINIFISVATPHNANAAFKRCKDIVYHCRQPYLYDQSICLGYMEGLSDKGDKGVCMTDYTTPKQIIDQYLKWVKKHPDYTFDEAPICFTKAMIAGFPCQ
jgi:hypothetical protein